jgi:hypothetical protein
MLTEKEQAALEQFEAEYSRRIDEKVEKGIAIRVPPTVVIMGVADDVDARIEDAKTWTIAQLKAAGETREIYFEDDAIEVIITGVPRAGRDNEAAVERLVKLAKERGHPNDPILAQAAKARPVPPPPEPEPEPERHYVRVQVRPSSENDPGEIREAHFATDGSLVRVWDLQGRLIGSGPIRPDEDSKAAAQRILKAKTCGNNFYRPITYPKSSIH